MGSETPLVYIVDDDPSVRESLDSLLRSVGLAVLVFETGQAFLDAERADVPSCLILDVRLPGSSGLEFQRQLASSELAPPIVFITAHGDVPMSVAAMKAGAVEFLTKPFRDQDLLDAVQRAVRLDRDARAEAAVTAGLRDRFAMLTPREREILALVTDGRMNKQIAGDLKLSEVTVKVHRAQVMQKLQANSLADLVRIADRLAGATRRHKAADTKA
ncbi:response regulator transcription factor [Enterovirga rhinocerotis]|uniref:LuxR family two component transcriptional regulator n=1 Tax=Enterovirga rhinocerotis TaxID=1339210 RepID=A0A4R7BJA4_9HYPH|nr:response regulator transcription factor [Enterovirga rhinocerotis]TDR85241.1 LuxR family two component transcriptional regulator [Enterovirga rhinocerotis]